MTRARKNRELCTTTQKAGRFPGKFVKMVGWIFLQGWAEICGTDEEQVEQTAREAAKYNGLSYACFHPREKPPWNFLQGGFHRYFSRAGAAFP